MPATFAHRALDTHVQVLADGRAVALRQAVPSDAPRLSVAFGASRDIRCDHNTVAFDEHGTIVGHAASVTDVAVAPGWTACGLENLLADSADNYGTARRQGADVRHPDRA